MALKEDVLKAISETKTKITFAALMAFIEVESGGRGFDPNTKKILIQFEPHWFKRKSPNSPGGIWSVNKVSVQSEEWKAFSDAYKHNPDAAMESTSIGLPQIMGFHYARLGYKNVGEMWDDFKVGEINQIKALIRFIETDVKLCKALLALDWKNVASIYNGSGYIELAKKYGRETYDISMGKAYKKYS